MDKTKLAAALLIFCFTFSGCEKDDICVDGNTPLLVVRFYDAENPTTIKAVPRLRVYGQGKTVTVGTFADRTNLDSIAIPLRPDRSDTAYSLVINSQDDEEQNESGNIDNLTLTYDAKDVFVSRACGFVSNYENLSDGLETDSDNWIKDIEIVLPSVTNSASAHVKIFH